ncbi:glycosyltransferase [Parvibium lacunae]|uniref:Glycosyltransferase family 2 protein n=1 Tax=Parvibium lacunae TaxID=1888893 RepID=A0A368L0J0_9BURK|nr:glycosyltransferase family A protein [Parvibium lacunae]RCS57056.1 glycosyltransferase family 2 protein [Parvibium lacunae]
MTPSPVSTSAVVAPEFKLSATRVPLVIVSPVRDEAALIRLTLDAMLQQTVLPVEWVIVDDGSTDATPAIVAAYAARYPFIRLVHNPDRGYRKVGAGVVVAFKFGVSQIQYQAYQYLAKMDGDMSFGPHYLAQMFAAFDADPRLAAISGKVFRPEGNQLVEEAIIDEHVAGQFKLYRRAAYEEIGGFVEEVLWDGIDVHMARMKGWHTQSIPAPEARLYHHRLMGSSDKNVFRGRMRWGRGIWFMGYHPLYALASALFRMREKPRVIGGLVIFFAYCKAAVTQHPRYDYPGFREYLQDWQLAQLKQKAAGLLTKLGLLTNPESAKPPKKGQE